MSQNGFPSQSAEYRTDAKNTTVEPVREGQHGPSVLAYSVVRSIGTGTVSSVSDDELTLSISTARVGDFLSFTSGAAAGRMTKVIASSGSVVEIADRFASGPVATDTFELLRHDFPRVNSSGEFITTGGGGASASTYATRVDEASATVTYVGEAQPGVAAASALWRIKRITVSGVVTLIEWADGNSDFDNVWNNRASLSYS